MYIMILTLRFLNFTNSFVEVNADVGCNGNHNFSELMNKSKPGSNSNKNAILIFLFLTSLFFSSADKTKT